MLPNKNYEVKRTMTKYLLFNNMVAIINWSGNFRLNTNLQHISFLVYFWGAKPIEIFRNIRQTKKKIITKIAQYNAESLVCYKSFFIASVKRILAIKDAGWTKLLASYTHKIR